MANNILPLCGQALLMSGSDLRRFWSKVEKTDECWNWLGAKSNFGHGRFKLGGKLLSPHRLSYELHHGDIGKGLLVCHKCNNPSCVNPEHLYAGTSSDNARDAVAAGTHNALSRIPWTAKLTADLVREIRSRSGEKACDLAVEYGVHIKTIEQLRSRRTWKNVV